MFDLKSFVYVNEVQRTPFYYIQLYFINIILNRLGISNWGKLRHVESALAKHKAAF